MYQIGLRPEFVAALLTCFKQAFGLKEAWVGNIYTINAKHLILDDMCTCALMTLLVLLDSMFICPLLLQSDPLH